MKVANLETKRKKNYTPELYFDVIEEIKRQYGDGIFREKPDLFAQVAALMGGDTAEKKAKRRRETNIANLNKRSVTRWIFASPWRATPTAGKRPCSTP